MKAEALIGTVLGTCTLQKLIGQGGMGAVFLAQQSRPKRQVAVKVLLSMRPLSANQLAAFLERFRRETDAAASMEHPNIMPVHEYGEREGLAYLVMPYISGGTLREELERYRVLPLEKISNYLEQIAAAIDFAHEHGVIHRDIKPANIMVMPEGRLLLGDFGLVKIVADDKAPQANITGVGAPVGTPDYMSPEQVLGEAVDIRADLYSLGVVLYQMVTGTTPFRGETPMQIAAQHLHVPPPSAQMMRPDLPIEAEQVLQRALAKSPSDRYESAQDLAYAFRKALMNAGLKLQASYYTNGLVSGSTTGRFAIPKGQFDPIRQTASMPRIGKPAPVQHNTDRYSSVRKDAGVLPVPALNADVPQASAGLLSRTGKFPVGDTSAYSSVQSDTSEGEGGLLSRTGKFPMVGTGAVATVHPPASQIQGKGSLVGTGKHGVATNAYVTPRMAGVATRTTSFAPQSQGTLQSPADTIPAMGKRTRQEKQMVHEAPKDKKQDSFILKDQAQSTGEAGKFMTESCSVGVDPVDAASIGEEQSLSLPDPIRDILLIPRVKIVLVIAAIVLLVAGLTGFLVFTHHTPTPSENRVGITTKVVVSTVMINSIDGTNEEEFHGR